MFVGFVLATQYRVAGGDGGDVGARFLLIGAPIVVGVICCVDFAHLGRRLSVAVVALACLPMLALVVDQTSQPVTPELIAEYESLDVAYVVSPNMFLANELWKVQPQRQFVFVAPDTELSVREVADRFAMLTDRSVAVALPEDNRPDLGDRYCRVNAPQNERVGISIYVTRDQGDVACA
jgi:hypothetical protein